MGQLQEIDDELIELGYQIIAISPDKPEKVRSLVESSKNKNYLLLSDSPMAAAQALGVAFKVDDKTLGALKNYNIDLEEASGKKHHLLPVPAVFIADKDRKIVFQYVDPNYRQRIPGKLLLEAARSLR